MSGAVKFVSDRKKQKQCCTCAEMYDNGTASLTTARSISSEVMTTVTVYVGSVFLQTPRVGVWVGAIVGDEQCFQLDIKLL